MKRRGEKDRTSDIYNYRIFTSYSQNTKKDTKNDISVGQIISVDIRELDEKGRGTTRLGDFTIVINGATVGDRVKAKIEKVQGNVAYGRPIKVDQSPSLKDLY